MPPAAEPESVKAAALRLAENLPDDATWADVQYEVYVRESIAAGLRDIAAGRVVSTEDVRRRLGLPL